MGRGARRALGYLPLVTLSLLGAVALTIPSGCSSFGADSVVDAGAPEAAATCVAGDLHAPIEAPDASCGGSAQNTDLTRSDSDCGRCGHSCMMQGCASGQCLTKDLFAVTDEPVGTHVLALGSVDATTVYLAYGARILVASLDGSQAPQQRFSVNDVGTVLSAPLLAAGRGWTIARTIDQTKLVSFAIKGDVVPKQEAMGVVRIATDGANVYWVEALTRSVRVVGKDPPIFDGASTSEITAMVADDDGLFLMVKPTDPATPTRLVAVARGGGSVSDLTTATSPFQMATDGGYVYWAELDGSVWRAAKASTSKEQIMQLPATRPVAKGIAFDEQNVYVIASLNGSAGEIGGSLYSAPKCGGPARLLRDDKVWADGLFARGDYLYWSHQAAIARIAR